MDQNLKYLSYQYTGTPRCPHCGEDQRDFADRVSWQDGEIDELDCDSCGKPFVCQNTMTIEFSTAIDEEAASDEMWGPHEREPAEPPTSSV